MVTFSHRSTNDEVLDQGIIVGDQKIQYLHMHAYMSSRTRIVSAVPKYGEHAWEGYVIISWRHNLGGTFLYFMSR